MHIEWYQTITIDHVRSILGDKLTDELMSDESGHIKCDCRARGCWTANARELYVAYSSLAKIICKERGIDDIRTRKDKKVGELAPSQNRSNRSSRNRSDAKKA